MKISDIIIAMLLLTVGVGQLISGIATGAAQQDKKAFNLTDAQIEYIVAKTNASIGPMYTNMSMAVNETQKGVQSDGAIRLDQFFGFTLQIAQNVGKQIWSMATLPYDVVNTVATTAFSPNVIGTELSAVFTGLTNILVILLYLYIAYMVIGWVLSKVT